MILKVFSNLNTSMILWNGWEIKENIFEGSEGHHLQGNMEKKKNMLVK